MRLPWAITVPTASWPDLALAVTLGKKVSNCFWDKKSDERNAKEAEKVKGTKGTNERSALVYYAREDEWRDASERAKGNNSSHIASATESRSKKPEREMAGARTFPARPSRLAMDVLGADFIFDGAPSWAEREPKRLDGRWCAYLPRPRLRSGEIASFDASTGMLPSTNSRTSCSSSSFSKVCK